MKKIVMFYGSDRAFAEIIPKLKMERSELFEWVKETYGTAPDYPWNDWNAVLRHAESKKWYAVILEVSVQKLGLAGNQIIDILNVKSDPLLIGSLRSKQGYFPAYHMNKEKWVSIALDGSVPDDEIKNLLDMSYKLTRK